MAGIRGNGVDRRHRRRWAFSDCSFDEANWSLSVGGRRVSVESKPLELLRELLLADGNLVSKDELLDRIWPDVHVVEASLPTAVRKLRLALGEDERDHPIIETVQRIGYRIAVPVEVEEGPAPPSISAAAIIAAGQRTVRVPRLLSISGALLVAVGAMAFALSPSQHVSATKVTQSYTQHDAADAIRELDIERIKRMIAAGWNPAAPWDKEGNDALGALLNRCEWDRGHEERKMLLMARTLIEGGAPIDRRNVWGDTAYSIAKAPRYCGPDHPVTQMLEAMCYGGDMGPKDLCLATYELTADQRRAQGLPPKAAKRRA